MVKKLYILLQQFGFNGKQFINSLKGLPSFLKDYILISQQIKKQIDFKKLSIYPCLFDKFDDAGTMSGHYFHQDLYVAQKIFKNNLRVYFALYPRSFAIFSNRFWKPDFS